MKELQYSIIGSIMQDNKLYYQHKEILINTEAFDDPDIKEVAKYVFERLENNEKVTLPILLSQFKKKRSVIRHAVTYCEPHAIAEHIDRVVTEYRRLKYIEVFRKQSLELLEGADPDEIKLKIEKDLSTIDGNKADKHLNWTKQIQTALDNILLAREKKGLTGISYQMSAIDKATGGLQKTDLIILAARPSMGKTTYAIQLCDKAAELRDGVTVYISLEMSTPQIIEKLISRKTGITVTQMRTGQITHAEFDTILKGADLIDKLNIIIIDYVNDIEDIKHVLISIAYKYPINLVCIDYLQLIGSKQKFQNKNALVESITRELKKLSNRRVLNCPTIVLSQLSREVEKRADKKPMLSDLRDSGAIEQDADIVLFPYRPEYYNEDTLENAEIIVAKNRHGALLKNDFRFSFPFNNFVDLEAQSYIGVASDNQIMRATNIESGDEDLQF